MLNDIHLPCAKYSLKRVPVYGYCFAVLKFVVPASMGFVQEGALGHHAIASSVKENQACDDHEVHQMVLSQQARGWDIPVASPSFRTSESNYEKEDNTAAATASESDDHQSDFPFRGCASSRTVQLDVGHQEAACEHSFAITTANHVAANTLLHVSPSSVAVHHINVAGSPIAGSTSAVPDQECATIDEIDVCHSLPHQHLHQLGLVQQDTTAWAPTFQQRREQLQKELLEACEFYIPSPSQSWADISSPPSTYVIGREPVGSTHTCMLRLYVSGGAQLKVVFAVTRVPTTLFFDLIQSGALFQDHTLGRGLKEVIWPHLNWAPGTEHTCSMQKGIGHWGLSTLAHGYQHKIVEDYLVGTAAA